MIVPDIAQAWMQSEPQIAIRRQVLGDTRGGRTEEIENPPREIDQLVELGPPRRQVRPLFQQLPQLVDILFLKSLDAIQPIGNRR